MVHNLWMLLCISEVIGDAVLIVLISSTIFGACDGKEKLFLLIMRKRKRGNGEKEKKSGEIVKESHCSRGNGLFICLRDIQIVSLCPSTHIKAPSPLQLC